MLGRSAGGAVVRDWRHRRGCAIFASCPDVPASPVPTFTAYGDYCCRARRFPHAAWWKISRKIHPSGSHLRRTRAKTRPPRTSRSAEAVLSIRLGAPQSPLIASLIESALTPESSTVNGAAARSNFTLLRTLSQPSAPLNAVDFTVLPDCATSIQPSADRVIL